MTIYLPMKRMIRKRFNTFNFRFEISHHTKGEKGKWKQAIPSPMDILYINNVFRKALINTDKL